jgi:hypothetical protein
VSKLVRNFIFLPPLILILRKVVVQVYIKMFDNLIDPPLLPTLQKKVEGKEGL